MKLLKKITDIFFKKTSASKPITKEVDEILASVKRFQNRAVHKILTPEIIDNTPDEQLLQTVFDNISVAYVENYKGSGDELAGLTLSQQAIYCIWILSGEVNNGGFNQYYFNTQGKYYHLLPGFLELVGAVEMSALVTKANRVYETCYQDITRLHDGSLEGFSSSYEDNPLNGFDDEFYRLSEVEDIELLQVCYIRLHKMDFC